MNTQAHVQPKARSDDTRARIIEVADGLFRRLGFAKTAVADIAAELGMSPANVYRFFSSKNAIVEAICQRCLSELDGKAWAIARSREPSPVRLERLFIEILRYHRENLITEKRVHDIVLVAMENNWDAIRAHTEVIRNIVELILRDGIASRRVPADGPARDIDAYQAFHGRVRPPDHDCRVPRRRARPRSGRTRDRALPHGRHHTAELNACRCRFPHLACQQADDLVISSAITNC